MSKSKEGRPEEFYKSQIRSLKKEVQYLRKRIKQLENFIGDPEKRERKEPIREENLCPECSKGTLTEVEFAGRMFEICYVCKFRRKIKALKRKR
jgi:hypothetical protein